MGRWERRTGSGAERSGAPFVPFSLGKRWLDLALFFLIKREGQALGCTGRAPTGSQHSGPGGGDEVRRTRVVEAPAGQVTDQGGVPEENHEPQSGPLCVGGSQLLRWGAVWFGCPSIAWARPLPLTVCPWLSPWTWRERVGSRRALPALGSAMAVAWGRLQAGPAQGQEGC